MGLGRTGLAQESLFVAAARAGQIRVDGELGEWAGARATRLGDADGGSAQVMLAHDTQGLFIAARVRDDAMVRSARPSAREDALVLSLALPRAGRFVTQEIWLYAGVTGRLASRMLDAAGRPLRAPASIVEASHDEGYTLEAFVPWSTLPGGADFAFARGAVRLHDVDAAGQKPNDDATSARARTGSALPWLLFDGGPAMTVTAFLRDRSLSGATPKLDRVADVRGDARAERVLVVGTHLIVAQADQRFRFADLPVTTSAGVLAAELIELTGDDAPELLLRLRQQNELGTRELLQVWDLHGEQLTALFGIETRKQTSDGEVSAEVDVHAGKAGKPGQIVAQLGAAQGLSAENYRERTAHGVEPILLPWGELRERRYAWDGTRFAVASEQPNPAARRASASSGAAAGAPPAAVAGTQAPAAPGARVHSQPPSSTALIAAYRQARGVPASTAARFVTHANLAEDRRLESVLLIGTELVVVGEGFRGGTGFFYFTLPVSDAAHVLRMFTGDVTGDGRREVFVRIKQQIGDVSREILLGYSFVGEALSPILMVEVRRMQAGRSIGNIVDLVRSGRHFALRIAPGVARGWSEANYPFTAGSSDDIGALLLPWQDGVTRYRFDGSALVPAQHD